MSPGYLFAWLLPLIFGCGVWAACAGMPRTPLERAAMLAGGLPLGLFGAAALVGLLHPADTHALLEHVGPWLFVAALIAWGIARLRQARAVPRVRISPTWRTALPRWVAIAALVLLALRCFILLDEAWLRPVYPWDAWWVWAARAKAWYLGGSFDPMVATDAWLAAPGGAARTVLAYNYPPLMSWLELWLAAGAGAWMEPAIDIAWPFAFAALLVGHYAQWRALNVPAREATVAVYILGSLPLLNVHAALAGYADLWVLTCFGFALLSGLRWQEQGDRGHAVLAALYIVLLASLKFEGLAWAGCAVVVLGAAAVPRARRVRVVLIAAGVVGVLVAVSAALHAAWFELARNLLSGATGGRTATPGAILRAVAAALYTQRNWHLAWYLLPLIVALRWRVIATQRATRTLGALLALAFAFVIVLFVFTPAAKWAESYTAVNRLLLELVPIAVTFGLLALRPPATPVPVRTPAAAPAPTR